LGLLLTELQPAWAAAREDRLHEPAFASPEPTPCSTPTRTFNCGASGNTTATPVLATGPRSSTPSAELKWWRVLQRCTGRRDLLPEIIDAIAGLVSDKSAGLTW
jgi:hypothetical protein